MPLLVSWDTWIAIWLGYVSLMNNVPFSLSEISACTSPFFPNPLGLYFFFPFFIWRHFNFVSERTKFGLILKAIKLCKYSPTQLIHHFLNGLRRHIRRDWVFMDYLIAAIPSLEVNLWGQCIKFESALRWVLHWRICCCLLIQACYRATMLQPTTSIDELARRHGVITFAMDPAHEDIVREMKGCIKQVQSISVRQ